MLKPLIKDILSVQELSLCIQQLLTDAFPYVAVCGEVSNLRQSNGITYFTLKDKWSQVAVVFFKTVALKAQIKEGETLVVDGRIDVYVKTGRYQIIGYKVRAVGSGYWQQRLEALKQMLASEGLFDKSRKKALPVLPQHIGVITSKESAAFKDFIGVLRRKQWKGHVTLFPSLVQGDRAACTLIQALRAAEKIRSIDLIAIVRGGGSLEDLWCFNDETFVRTIANSKKPIMSGIGHEIDHTLCDFVADLRVETPTAAAEKIANEYVHCIQKTDALAQRFKSYACIQFRTFKQNFLLTTQHLLRISPYDKMQWIRTLIENSQRRLCRSFHQHLNGNNCRFTLCATRFKGFLFQRRIAQSIQHLRQQKQRFNLSLQHHLRTLFQKVDLWKTRLENVSLESHLQKGFLIPLSSKGNPKAYASFKPDMTLTLMHKSGKYCMHVKAKDGPLHSIS
ncbi:MAG: exodeoxyribonuclease VII large subunit [Puniceicoccales bacterium]|jgi:exodeoxyribonuclease VII large subunit|nr:exodeoxyribonuclease VII large subunit [Puniceicoccales bacterium]